MPTLAAALKQEVSRLAAREVKKVLRPLRKVQRQVTALRLDAKGYRRTLLSVERRFVRLKARVARGAGSAAERGRRIAGDTVRALRRRLGMTRLEFAKVLNVSPGSIFGWESGRTVPRGKNVARILEVKKMGVRKARARAEGPETRRAPVNGRRRGARRRGRR
jgi:DNA-binding transcriptional regulator YiaG